MKFLKQKKVLKFLFAIFILFLTYVIFIIIFNKNAYENYKNEVNSVMSNVILEVKKKYKDVDEVEIIKIFNDKASVKDNDVLKKYGLNYEDVSVLESLEKSYNKNILTLILLAVLFFVAIILFLICYLYKKEKDVYELVEYVNYIIDKRYDLKIKDNEEGMISKLKNDLYKLMIMLKEAYSNENREKESLKIAIEDISHQLKTPLTASIIMLDNLSDENVDENLRKKFLNDVKIQIEKMSFLIKTLLTLSRFDAGVISFKKERISVSKLISKVSSNLSVLAEIKGVTIDFKKDDEVFFNGDYKWEEEAITNVIKNAIEHSKPRSKVKIDYSYNAVYTEISITNHGDVIDKKDMKNIFKRFYKGKNATKESIGIGLALSKSIITKDDGYISVSSDEKNGTVFKIKYLRCY